MEVGQRVKFLIKQRGRPFTASEGEVITVTNASVIIACKGKTYSRDHKEVCVVTL